MPHQGIALASSLVILFSGMSFTPAAQAEDDGLGPRWSEEISPSNQRSLAALHAGRRRLSPRAPRQCRRHLESPVRSLYPWSNGR
jgi:hypothetical protein